MIRTDFGDLLQEAAALARELPRSYHDASEAQRRTTAWQEQHPDVRVDLLVDRPPGSPRAEYDLLLGDPAGGTLALTWREEDGLPWAVSYADHWAANYVVTVDDGRGAGVDGQGITVQQALLALQMSAEAHPSILDELVSYQLLLQAIERERPATTAEELQQAADAFRRQKGLHSAAETLRWLEELGMPLAQFESMLEVTVQARKVRQQVVAERIDAYFEEHSAEYDRLRVLQVRTPSLDVAEHLAARAHAVGLLAAAAPLFSNVAVPVEISVGTGFARTLPAELRAAASGETVGPFLDDRSCQIAYVYGRQAASLDAETRAAVDEAVFQAWLAERRAAATVRWHWM